MAAWLGSTERLLLLGDSITEAGRYSRIVEGYLAACRPGAGIQVRNAGKGGETAEGFLGRLEEDCLAHRPSAATLCYGMNDSAYMDHNAEGVRRYRAALERILDRLQEAGVRVLLASPTCVGKLPPWPVIADLGSTLEGINATLAMIRDAGAELAQRRGLPFLDLHTAMLEAQRLGRSRHGAAYAVCGYDDGVHPSWAGHAVLAWCFLKALGLDGDLGELGVDLGSGKATAARGHVFKGMRGEDYVFESRVYPFCAEGLPDRDWSLRSGMDLVPFDRDLNRLTLTVTSGPAKAYRVAWMGPDSILEEWRDYSAAELARGVNLAADFQRNPFGPAFGRLDDLVRRKQKLESEKTWRPRHPAGGWPDDNGLAWELRRAELQSALDRSREPVTHNLRIQAL